jgi:hypothetical protein
LPHNNPLTGEDVALVGKLFATGGIRQAFRNPAPLATLRSPVDK